MSTLITYIEAKWGVILWVLCAVIASIFAFFVKGMIDYIWNDLEDLRRLNIDDVKNSEYIEEGEIRRFSMEQRSNFFNESNIVSSEGNYQQVQFEFAADGGTGGQLNFNKMNRSHDFSSSIENKSPVKKFQPSVIDKAIASIDHTHEWLIIK